MGTEKFQANPKFNREKNIIEIAGTEMTIHCHHYNIEVQRTLEFTDYVDGPKMMKRAAEEVFYKQFTRYLDVNGVEDNLGAAAEMYRTFGLGRLDFSGLDKGLVRAPASHIALGWRMKYGERGEPGCHVTAGYVAGIMRAINHERYEVEERQCMGMGADSCQFRVREARGDEALELKFPESRREEFQPAPKEPVDIETNVDEDAIISGVSSMGIAGGEDGYIPAFGVYLALLPVDFYNWACYGFEKELEKLGFGLEESARELLVFAGEVCGLNTLGGVMASPQWDAMIRPMIKREEDKVFALTAVTNCIGCGNWQVYEFDPGERLVMRAYTPYEALGYRSMYGLAETGKCYSLQGMGSAIMELVYSRGDADERIGTFPSEEVQCIAKGDPFCEFVITRK